MDLKKGRLDYSTYHLLLNEKHFQLKHQQRVSTRALHHWRKTGLLDDHREYAASGNRNYFSPVDLVWISIIADLRQLQIENGKIKSAKHGCFKPISADDKNLYPALEYYMMHIFEFNIPIYIIMTDTDQLLIMNDIAYFDKLKSGAIENHITISLNKQIKDALHEVYCPPDFSEFAGLSTTEIQVLNIIRSKTYKYIKITKKDGEISRLEGTEQIKKATRIADLLKKGAYQNLEIKQHNGKVVCINRTIRKKIEK